MTKRGLGALCLLIQGLLACGDTLPLEADDAPLSEGSSALVTGGTLIWEAVGTGPGGAVAADNNGNTFVTGSIGGDIVVRKYDSNGAIVWTTTYDGGVGPDSGHDIAVDGNGDAVITGYITTATQGCNIFVGKVDGTSGDFLWRKDFDGGIGWDDYGTGVAVNAAGDVFVTGSLIGVQPWDTMDDKDPFLYGLHGSDGTLFASGSMGIFDQDDWGIDLAVNDSGTIFMAWYWIGKYDWSGYVSKYEVSGSSFSGVGGHGWTNFWPTAVAADPTGGFVVTGDKSYVGQGYTMKVDDSNNVLWAMDDGVGTMSYDVAMGKNGEIVLAGSTQGTDKSRWLVRRLSPAGNEIWSYLSADSAKIEGSAKHVAIDNLGFTYAVGYEKTTDATSILVRKFAL